MEDKGCPNTERKTGRGIRFTPTDMQVSQEELLVSKLQMRWCFKAPLWFCHSWGNEGQGLQEGQLLRILETAGLWQSFNQELKDKVKTAGPEGCPSPFEAKIAQLIVSEQRCCCRGRGWL